MDGKSQNILHDQLAKLKEAFPEVVSENGVDWEKLKLTLGDDIALTNERYVLNWAGKSDAFRAIQTQTTATLKPQREQSIDFDTTQNIFIEGENLEVLKVLQKSYYGKVKMIYIDPPYNTGNDSFIYPDKFSESKAEYLKRIGDKDEAGYLTKEGFFRKNSKENGQYHSNWLSMMYPRLFLARNLLRDDGVIFVSIDDNEVHNLRLVVNEIFGEENFEGHIHWRRRHNQPNDKTKMIALVGEHILAYTKNSESFKNSGVGTIDLTGDFSNPDNDLRGDWASKPWKVGSDQNGSKYTIITPTGKTLDDEWMGEEETYKALLADKRIVFPKKGDGYPRKKYFRFERQEEGQSATNWWTHEQFGHNQGANERLSLLFGVKNIFSNPKPTELIRGLLQISDSGSDDIVLDFFAGAGTTADAIFQLNKEDGLARRFILVQLPEKTEEDTEAYKAGYKTISEISKARVRKASETISKEIEKETGLFDKTNIDLGFKVFTLEPSNFKIWRTDVIETEAELKRQMEVFVDPVRAVSEADSMAWEILLKSGFELTTPLEKIEIGGVPAYSIAGGEVLLLLEAATQEAIDAIIKQKSAYVEGQTSAGMPQHVICLDRLFQGNDQMKTNTVLQMKDAGVEFRTI